MSDITELKTGNFFWNIIIIEDSSVLHVLKVT